VGLYGNYREDFLSAQAMVVVGVQKKPRGEIICVMSTRKKMGR
jgi:hypothetical protein